MLIVWILIAFGALYLLQRAVYMLRWNKKISVTFRFSQRSVTEGGSVTLSERSENRKLLPLPNFGYRYTLIRSFESPSAETGKTTTIKRKFGLPGRRAVTCRTKVDGLRRGIYSVDGVSVFAADLFHSSELESPIGFGSSRLTVYPAKIPVGKILPAARQLLGAVTTKRRMEEDPFALKSIRPYEIFDSPRTINWKASARTGELKVNQYENTSDESLVFILDMESGSEEAREQVIRAASSFCLFFLRRGVSVSVVSNGRSCFSGEPIRVPAASDSAHQVTIDENLALIKPSLPAEPLKSFLSELPRGTADGALPVVLSADTTGSAHEAFLRSSTVRDGYFISVTEEGGVSADSRLTLTSRGAEGKEARL